MRRANSALQQFLDAPFPIFLDEWDVADMHERSADLCRSIGLEGDSLDSATSAVFRAVVTAIQSDRVVERRQTQHLQLIKS